MFDTTSTCYGSLVPRLTGIISAGARKTVWYSQFTCFPKSTGTESDTYIVHETIEMATVDEFSQGMSYSFSCVGLPGVALKCEQLAAAIRFLYE